MSVYSGDVPGENEPTGENLDFRTENLESKQETEYFVNIKDAKTQERQAKRRAFSARLRGSIYGWAAVTRQRLIGTSKRKKFLLVVLFIILVASLTVGALFLLRIGSTESTDQKTTGTTRGTIMTEEELSEYNNYERTRSVLKDAGAFATDKSFEEKRKTFEELLEDYSGNPDVYFFLRLRYADFLLREGNDSDGALRALESIDSTTLNNAKLDYYYTSYISVYTVSGDVTQLEECKQKRTEARRKAAES